MNEQREQAYSNLINQLLICPNGQEAEILQQNRELLDNGFLQTATYYARKLQEDGKEQPAAFLLNLVQQLSQVNLAHNEHQTYLDFLLEILRKINSGANQKQIYLLFQQNLDKLN